MCGAHGFDPIHSPSLWGDLPFGRFRSDVSQLSSQVPALKEAEPGGRGGFSKRDPCPPNRKRDEQGVGVKISTS